MIRKKEKKRKKKDLNILKVILKYCDKEKFQHSHLMCLTIFV